MSKPKKEESQTKNDFVPYHTKYILQAPGFQIVSYHETGSSAK